jgi:N-acetylglucosaminyldiphosphoundecaprenol N-acetyl-beta-D-mannosaminyltransferase
MSSDAPQLPDRAEPSGQRPLTTVTELPKFKTMSQLRVGCTAVDFVPLAVAADDIASGRLRGGVHLCNAYTLALAAERPDVAAALDNQAANLPDGVPLVWWARSRGVSDAERVYGPDLMEAAIDVGRQFGTAHYLYGSTPDVLAALEQAIVHRWPGARVVGSESPPFRDLTDDDLANSIRRAEALDASIIWVGMGTPKQDLLVARMSSMSDRTFVAIGAAFDFLGGTKSQAPRWVMRLGMEWFYRLITEPRRLWRRYLLYNLKFLLLLWRSRRERATTGR